VETDSSALESEHGDTDHQDGSAKNASAPGATIDIAKLTAKVYQLMRDELRLERARGAGARNR
jgi:hypothetical protein